MTIHLHYGIIVSTESLYIQRTNASLYTLIPTMRVMFSLVMLSLFLVNFVYVNRLVLEERFTYTQIRDALSFRVRHHKFIWGKAFLKSLVMVKLHVNVVDCIYIFVSVVL